METEASIPYVGLDVHMENIDIATTLAVTCPQSPCR